MAEKVVMPQLGESVVEGTIVEWFVKVGDELEPGTPLVEVETDKANTEVPATDSGFVRAILASEGDTIAVGEPILEIVSSRDELEAAAAEPEEAPATEAEPEPEPEPASTAPPEPSRPAAQPSDSEDAPPPPPRPAPAVSSSIQPWNRGDGVAAPAPTVHPGLAIAQSSAPPAPPTKPSRASAPTPPERPSGPFGTPPGARYFKPPIVKAGPDDNVVKFTKRRGIIAEHMVYSKHVSPHVPCFAEVDMTKVMDMRRANKARLAEQGIPLTMLSFVLKAVTQALREFPTLNAVVGADEMILRNAIHLGVAVETEEGLVVPVIRDADTLSVAGLAKAVIDIADKARNKKITIDDLSGGTFTVTNPGRRGNLFGAAVINQPQVGIIRMGEIVRRPVVRKVNGEEVICIRSMMYLALTYDHRIIDGVTGNGFLYRVRELLEEGHFQL